MMRIPDRYIAKSFLTGCAIALGVLVGLSIIVDLSVNGPIINLTMLTVSLPVLICRDPRTWKAP
jgi:lipopolysaccharide export LptBFGC system permease protein LptF